jgi:hypothetical protein
MFQNREDLDPKIKKNWLTTPLMLGPELGRPMMFFV